MREGGYFFGDCPHCPHDHQVAAGMGSGLSAPQQSVAHAPTQPIPAGKEEETE